MRSSNRGAMPRPLPMIRPVFLLVFAPALAAMVTVGAAAPARPVKLTKAAADVATAEIDKDRADTEKWLRSDPTSYLAAIDRRDFGDRKALPVGRAGGKDIRLDEAEISSHHLRVTVEGDRFHVVALDASARFRIKRQDTFEEA